MISVTDEYSLVLECLRAKPSIEDLARVAAAAERRPDWSEVIRVAEWHQVDPLVFQGLRSIESTDVPAAVMATLRRTWDSAVVRNLHRERHLQDITRALDRAGIPVMLLKGSALLETVYDSPAQRPMADLDLLVPSTDVGQAESVILDLGFTQSARTDGEDGRCHLPIIADPDRITFVEIHRHLRDKATFSLDGMWSRSRPSTRPGAVHVVPAPEDMVVHLCLHFVSDRESGSRHALRQVTDISETLRAAGSDLDWTLVEQIATEAHARTAVSLGLETVTALMGPDLAPLSVRRSIRTEALSNMRVDYFVNRRVLRAETWLRLESLAPSRRPIATLLRTRAGDGQRPFSPQFLLGRLRAGARLALSALLRLDDVVKEQSLTRLLREGDRGENRQ